jgi:hypothetical protein
METGDLSQRPDIAYDLPAGTLKMAFINQPILFNHPDYSDCWTVQVVHVGKDGKDGKDGNESTEFYRGYHVEFLDGAEGQFAGHPNRYGRKAWVETYGSVRVVSKRTREEQQRDREQAPAPKVYVPLDEYERLKTLAGARG